ncbi:MAG: uracil-DNA glycosylase [Myxococcota bacterium]
MRGILWLLVVTGCANAVGSDPPVDEDRFWATGKADAVGCPEPGSPAALAILSLVNDPRVDAAELDDSQRGNLDRRAAEGIVAQRPFSTLGDLDDVPWVGHRACTRLRDYACDVKRLCDALEPVGHYRRVRPEGERGLIALSLYSARGDYTATHATGECSSCIESESGSYALIDGELVLYAQGRERRYRVTSVGSDELVLDSSLTMQRVSCSASSELGCLIPPDWRESVADVIETDSFLALDTFLVGERERLGSESVLPQRSDVFAALEKVTPAMTRIVLIGQDPYPTPGHANGLCFSVNDGVEVPASLQTMYEEIKSDLRQNPPRHGNLSGWAEQGMLMLNTVLTVRAGDANSHRGEGWEPFTRAILRTVAAEYHPRVFLAFGGQAASEAEAILADQEYIDVAPDGTWSRVSPSGREIVAVDAYTLTQLSAAEERALEGSHFLVRSAHPAPPFSHRRFLGSRPYTRVNTSLSIACRSICAEQGLPATRSACPACRFDWTP